MTKPDTTLSQPDVLDRLATALDWLSLHPFVTISFFGLLISLPLILFGLPVGSHDAVSHAFYANNFSHQLSLGEIYPRWLYLANGGLGAPTFFSYQPLPYYIAHIFTLLPSDVMHQLGAAAAFGVILSGIFAVLWLREIVETRFALIGAFLYMIMPYPVAHDVYVRSAFGEAFTFVLMPLILFFVVRISRGGRLAVLGLVVSYAALCLTHLPITVIFSGIPVLYVWFLAVKEQSHRYFAMTIGGMLLGAGIAAMYIIPAVAYQSYANLHELREGHFHYSFWLMTSELAIRGSWTYFWMPVSVSLAGVASFIAGSFLVSSDRRRELLFWVVILIASFFMMLHISSPIWETFLYLQALQFPFRVNAISSIAALPLIVLAISTVKRPFKWHSMVIMIMVTGFGVYWANDFRKVASEAFFVPGDGILAVHARVHRMQLETHGRWPRTVPFGDGDLEKNLAKIPTIDGERAKAYVTAGTANINVLKWRPREIDLNIEATSEVTVNVSQFHFHGWRARIPGLAEDLPIRPTPDLGLISITVPPGNRYVKVTLDELWPEFIAEWISAACVLLTVGLFLWLIYHPKTRPTTDDLPN